MCQNFRRETRSSTAVEFAIIGNVLMLLLIGFILMGVYQFWQLTLDDSVRNAAREVQTGQVASGPQFVAAVCSEFGTVAAGCETNLQYQVQASPSPTTLTFASITPATISGAGTLSPAAAFNATIPPAQNGTPVVVTAAYRLPLILPLVPTVLQTGNATASLISATAVMAYK